MNTPVSYPFSAVINGHKVNEILIGRHYLKRHLEVIGIVNAHRRKKISKAEVKNEER